MANIGWTIVKAVTGAAAAKAATPLVNAAWQVITPKARPKKNDFNSPLAETIAFTAMSAAVAGVMTMLAERRAAKWMGMDRVLGSATREIKEAVDAAEKDGKKAK